MIDVFSRYVWTIPLKDKESSTIHKELVKIFENFGLPNILQADNGSEFITDVLKRTCKAFKVFIFTLFFFIFFIIILFFFRLSLFIVGLIIHKVKEKLNDLIKHLVAI